MVESRPRPRHSRNSVPQAPHRHRKSFSLIALNIAIVFVLGAGTAAYGAFSKTVTLTVDGQRDTIRTFGGTVSDVLAAKHITVRDGDRLNVSPSHRLDDGDKINVAYAKPITLAVDGTVTAHTVYDRTVGQALHTLGVKPAPGAYLSDKKGTPIPRSGDELVVSNIKSLTVVADGKKAAITTKEPTVEGVLAAAAVKLDGDDEVNPGKGAFVKPHAELRVVRIKKVTRTETVPVDYPVQVRKDSKALAGEKTVVQAGKSGKTRERVTLIYADGKVRQRIVLVSRTLTEPRPQIESVGTSTTPPDSVWDKIAQCESGGNWQANTGNGYYGGLQFSAATWHSVGGPGLPNESSREVQIKYAKILQARSGWGQWSCAGARFN
jgi:uncharacterized protein YabE (DUF348 family)